MRLRFHRTTPCKAPAPGTPPQSSFRRSLRDKTTVKQASGLLSQQEEAVGGWQETASRQPFGTETRLPLRVTSSEGNNPPLNQGEGRDAPSPVAGRPPPPRPCPRHPPQPGPEPAAPLPPERRPPLPWEPPRPWPRCLPSEPPG